MSQNEIYAFLQIGALPLSLGLVGATFLICMFGLGFVSWFCFNKTALKIPFGICGCCLITIFTLLAVIFFTLGMVIRVGVTQACGDGEGNFLSGMFKQVYEEAGRDYGTADCPLKISSWVPENAAWVIDPVDGACGLQWCDDTVIQLVQDSLPSIPYVEDTPVEGELLTEVEEYNEDNEEKIGNCELWPRSTTDSKLDIFKKFLDILGAIEEKYECSGICEIEEIYYFSNVDNGEPTQACQEPMKNQYIFQEITGYSLGFLIFAVVLCVPWILNFVSCCLPGNGKWTKIII